MAQGDGLLSRGGTKISPPGSNPGPSAIGCARSSVRIERWPAEPEVLGSNPSGRAITCKFKFVKRCARSSVRKEHWPPEPGVAGSSPAGRVPTHKSSESF